MDTEAVKVLLEAQDRTFRTAIDLVVVQLKSRLQAAEGTVLDLTRSLEFSQQELKDLQSEVKVLKGSDKDHKDTIEVLKTRVVELEQRQNYQEDYNSRNNIRITWLQEQPGETWEETAITVSKLLEDKLQLPSMKIERAHHTGPAVPSRSRTVVARLEKFGDREAVVRNARKSRGTGIFINEDLCPASQEKKRSQLPLLKQAREDGKIAFFKHTKLIIKDRSNNYERQLSSVAVVGGGAARAGDVPVVAARFTRSSLAGSVGVEPSMGACGGREEVSLLAGPTTVAGDASSTDDNDVAAAGGAAPGGVRVALSVGAGATHRRQGTVRNRKK
ncbi:hypothetical protein Pcinc_021541 [Petrolisthes cinctipes]|uniref:Uncharacterized protein n=1 Tax=Petrolisthes cinctipes TaxID=88211 RepID=A0AAE1FFI3_PETCI|nr:hypothetical protein Pcinc_021541 [Petrolisthes cinctipes]